MNSETSWSAGRDAPVVRPKGHPILRVLVSFPIACFCGALVTDIVYAKTADIMWADFSDWLLAAGLAFGVLAAIGGIIDLLANRRGRTQRQVLPLLLGGILVLVLGLFDNLVHSRDAWTSVVPLGLTLSAVTVAVMLITAWLATSALSRPGLDTPYSGLRQ